MIANIICKADLERVVTTGACSACVGTCTAMSGDVVSCVALQMVAKVIRSIA